MKTIDSFDSGYMRLYENDDALILLFLLDFQFQHFSILLTSAEVISYKEDRNYLQNLRNEFLTTRQVELKSRNLGWELDVFTVS